MATRSINTPPGFHAQWICSLYCSSSSHWLPVTSCGPCAGHARTHTTDLMQQIPSYSLPAKLPALWIQLLVGHSKWVSCLWCLAEFYKAADPGEHSWPAIHLSFLFAPPAQIFTRWHVMWWYLVPHVMLMSCVLDLKCQFHFVVCSNLFLWQSIKNCTECWRTGCSSMEVEVGAPPMCCSVVLRAMQCVPCACISRALWCMPRAPSAPKSLPPMMNKVLQHLGKELLDINMEKLRHSVLLRSQSPWRRGQCTHLPCFPRITRAIRPLPNAGTIRIWLSLL